MAATTLGNIWPTEYWVTKGTTLHLPLISHQPLHPLHVSLPTSKGQGTENRNHWPITLHVNASYLETCYYEVLLFMPPEHPHPPFLSLLPTHIHTCTHSEPHAHTPMCTCIHAEPMHTHTPMHTCIQSPCTHTHAHVHTYWATCTHTPRWSGIMQDVNIQLQRHGVEDHQGRGEGKHQENSGGTSDPEIKEQKESMSWSQVKRMDWGYCQWTNAMNRGMIPYSPLSTPSQSNKNNNS